MCRLSTRTWSKRNVRIYYFNLKTSNYLLLLVPMRFHAVLVEGIDLVINYDVLGDAEDYIHRIGRTARASTTGTAITFVNHRDERKLKSIEDLIDRKLPVHEIPPHIASIAEVRSAHEPNKNNRNRGKKKVWNKGPRNKPA